MADDIPIKILLSSGGTGGHVFPAIALAHDLESRGYNVHFATDRRGASYIQGQFDYTVLASGTFTGRGLKGKILGALSLLKGYIKARIFIKNYAPTVVIGFGGYPSVPAVLAAQHKNIPTLLHEQNAIVGKANRYLAPKAIRIALSLKLDSEEEDGLESEDRVRSVVTGNPVRPEISALFTKPYPTLHGNSILNILVFGGSQGASVLSNIIPKSIEALSDENRKRLSITQQCRTQQELIDTQDFYKSINVQADCALFFDDMPDRLSKTHLVISRSGASTIAELSVAGRPALFVPYPHHGDQQQFKNAKFLADCGGAWVIPEEEFTIEAIQAQLKMFLQTPELLFKASESVRECAHPDAARKLGNLITAVALGWE